MVHISLQAVSRKIRTFPGASLVEEQEILLTQKFIRNYENGA
jgi:hypothetical protein